jgi:hypothetical protein
VACDEPTNLAMSASCALVPERSRAQPCAAERRRQPNKCMASVGAIIFGTGTG